MALTTRSSTRMQPPTKRSSRSRVVGDNKSKALVLLKGPTTRKSNQTINQSSQKQTPSIVNTQTQTHEMESDREDDLPDEEDIDGAFSSDSDESDSDESDAGHLHSDHEVLEPLTRSNPRLKTRTRSHTKGAGVHTSSLAKPDDDPNNLNARHEVGFAMDSPTNSLVTFDFDEEMQDNSVLPTIESYKGLVKEWPRKRITSVQLSQKKLTSVPPHILTEAKAIKKLYKHHKMMLAMMGNITTYTLDKSLSVMCLSTVFKFVPH